MSKTRRRFADEFKREAVGLCSQPEAVMTQVACNLDIDQRVLRRRVQMEHDILKKLGYFPKDPL